MKQAHECQESGETQEFNDELAYIMSGLDASQSLAVRSLSCLSLAQKCTASSFRMHLRAHGVLDKVFHKLHDAHNCPVSPQALRRAAPKGEIPIPITCITHASPQSCEAQI